MSYPDGRAESDSASGGPGETVPYPYHVLDAAGRIVRVNAAWTDALGYERDRIEGDRFERVLAEGSRDRFEAAFPSFDGEGVALGLAAADGETLPVSMDGEPEYEDGEVVRVHCQFHETTAKRECERERRRMKRAVDASGHAIYLTDADGEIEYVNQAFEETTGYSAAAAIGQDPSILKSGVMSEEYYERLWETLEAGEVWEEELVNRRRDGMRYHAHQTIAPVTGQDGEQEAYVATQTDITEKKGREQRLRYYKQTVESSTNLLAAVDENYRYLFANRRYREFHGIDPDLDLHGTPIAAFLDRSVLEEIVTHVDSALAGEDVEYEMTRTDASGQHRTLEVRYYPIENEAGETQGVVGAMRDITEKREQERELTEQKQRYESLFNSIRDAILVVDEDRRVVNCNPAFTDLFGYDLSEIEGRSTRLIYDDETEFEAVGEAIADNRGEQFTRKVDYRKRSGRVFPGQKDVFSLRDAAGEVVGYIGLIRDVSNRENRSRQIRVIDRVLRHNLRNNLNVIEGFASMVRESTAGELSAYAERITDASERLAQTADKERNITQFLSAQPQTEPLDVAPIVEEVVDGFRRRCPDAGLTVSTDESCRVDAVPQIHRAIAELVGNAITHSDRESPSVEVSVTPADATVRIAVADDGPGIPDIEQGVLTHGTEIEPLYHGSGLGLWYVNLLVQHSDGTLAFENNDPTGSVVTIRLPRP
jgi:PAS domain S-box-containing protein